MKKFLLSAATLFVATMSQAQTALPYSNSLLTDNGGFTQTTEYASEADKDSVPSVWNFDARFGAKASAYVKKVKYAVTSTLASPVFNVESSKDLCLTFEHAGQFFANPATDATLMVKTVGADGKESTQQVEIPTYFSNNDWKFVADTISLAQFEGSKTLQVLFVYKSSTEAAGTWEIKNFSLKGAGDTPVTPETSDTKLAAQFDFTNPTPAYTTTPAFTAWSTSAEGESSLGNITAIEKDGVKVEFPDGATVHARLWKGNNSYDLRVYKDQVINITAGEEEIAAVVFYAARNSDIKMSEASTGTALTPAAPAATRQRAVLAAKSVATWTAPADAETKSVSFTVTATSKLTGLEVLTVDKTTGVKAVDLASGKTSSIYDLQGRKLTKAGKGLFIVNGKKVLF